MNLLCSEATHVDYIARILSIAALVVSAFAVFVAWRQLGVARKKLRLDVSESTSSQRRREVYEATSKFVDAINNDPEHVDSYLNDFNTGTSNAELLFESDVVDYIQQIRKHAAGMRAAHKLIESPQRDEAEAARIGNIEKFQAEREWLIEQVQSGALKKTFAPHLGFENIKA